MHRAVLTGVCFIIHQMFLGAHWNYNEDSEIENVWFEGLLLLFCVFFWHSVIGLHSQFVEQTLSLLKLKQEYFLTLNKQASQCKEGRNGRMGRIRSISWLDMIHSYLHRVVGKQLPVWTSSIKSRAQINREWKLLNHACQLVFSSSWHFPGSVGLISNNSSTSFVWPFHPPPPPPWAT